MFSAYNICTDSQSQRYASINDSKFSCEYESGQEGCNMMFTDFHMFKCLQLVAHLAESIKEKLIGNQ